MGRAGLRGICLAAAIGGTCVGPVGVVLAEERISEQGERERNLRVIPRDATAREVLAVMKRITLALGTRCDTCHDTVSRDYASDALGRKRTAREMMRLAERIATTPLDWRNPPETLCVECHRGRIRPPD